MFRFAAFFPSKIRRSRSFRSLFFAALEELRGLKGGWMNLVIVDSQDSESRRTGENNARKAGADRLRLKGCLKGSRPGNPVEPLIDRIFSVDTCMVERRTSSRGGCAIRHIRPMEPGGTLRGSFRNFRFIKLNACSKNRLGRPIGGFRDCNCIGVVCLHCKRAVACYGAAVSASCALYRSGHSGAATDGC